VQLPFELRNALDRAAEHYSTADLIRASATLTAQYRDGNRARLSSDLDRLAYAVVRMPATYAVLRRIAAELSSIPVESVLDLGCGPGVSAWAVPAARHTLVDLDHGLLDLGRSLGAPGSLTWRAADLRAATGFEPHDLVVCSYSLGELDDPLRLAHLAWQATGSALVIVEPGTPRGFALIRSLRGHLLAEGAHMLAPCPHANACPMAEPDWCHFAQRVERSSLHRRLKGGSMGWEDEKFSYMIVTRQPSPAGAARIVRHPHPGSGHVKLQLCTLDGLEHRIVTRKSPVYKLARRSRWGGTIAL
jgi:ribosomal protein RSM22 (predicted rRNA methylase)